MSLSARVLRSPAREDRSRGFSLVETLAAFTILGLFTAAAFQAFSVGMSANVRTGEYAKAQILAKSKLSDLSVSDSLVPGENSGQVTLDGGSQTFRWRTKVEDAHREATGPLISLSAVVEVTWGGRDNLSAPRVFELHALLISKKP